MGPERQLEETLCDPMGEHVLLPIRHMFHPHGFPVEIATNSPAVIEAARESWGSSPREFERAPIRIRVLVEEGGSDPAPEPAYRSQRGLMLIVSDRHNFACCDLLSRFGWCHTSTNMLADRGWFRWFFLEAMVYLLLVQDDVVAVHAACVARNGRGVLLCGASGAGKSSLAFACAQSGWTYVSDDSTLLLQGSGDREALGKPHQFRFRPEAVELFPEIEGRAACIRPNGKPTVEVPVSAIPQVSTASRCRIERVVFLNRRSTGGALARPLTSQEALDRLLLEVPAYSEEVWRRHRDTVATLVSAPAYELQYRTFAQALPLLCKLVDES
jgi:serine kinase of HPr protein (carbohydrate metabolism regulator)